MGLRFRVILILVAMAFSVESDKILSRRSTGQSRVRSNNDCQGQDLSPTPQIRSLRRLCQQYGCPCGCL